MLFDKDGNLYGNFLPGRESIKLREVHSLEYVVRKYVNGIALNSIWRNTKISLMGKVSQAFP